MSATHVVMFSGGIQSWAAAKRVAAEHGTDGMVLLFADTRAEEADVYRFRDAAAANVGAELVVVADGRDPWQVFHDDRFLGNSRLANCSKYLKIIPCQQWLAEHGTPGDTTVVVGIDWQELHRIDRMEQAYAEQGFTFDAPLTRKPYLTRDDLFAWARSEGLDLPRPYLEGFPHANCLHPDTRFITAGGMRTLRECRGQEVTVLGKGGKWTTATVESFGEQELWELHLSRYNDEKTVLCTPDHIWFRRHGRTSHDPIETQHLKPGDRLANMHGAVHHNVRPSAWGIAHGVTFGDGSIKNRNTQTSPAHVVLCGDKDAQLLKWFPNSPTKERPGVGIEVRDLPRAWKEPPSLGESEAYLYGWLAGYVAADGTVGKSGTCSISSAERGNLEVVRDVCARLGIATQPIRRNMRRGYGTKDSALYSVALIGTTLREDFFLIEEHRQRFMARTGRSRPPEWQVVSVEPTGRREEVMCATVPYGHRFTLEDNLLTHNCASACVRGGQAQWALLWRTHPDRYRQMEANEEQLRGELGEVAILRDRSGGESRPMTLREFRERLEAVPDAPSLFDGDEWGGCGCVPEMAGGAA